MKERGKITFSSLEDVLGSAETIAVAGHVRPDGDCIGSCTALFLYLKKTRPGADVRLFLEPVKECFSGLPGIWEASCRADGFEPALLILSDVSSRERIGAAPELYETARNVICIDHHVSNPGLGMENRILPDASSSCEVVLGCIDRSLLDPEIALLLYMGIVHDTGCFAYPNVTPDTLRSAAFLLSFGIDASAMIDRTFSARTFREAKATGHILSGASLFCGGLCVSAMITKEEAEALGVTPAELDAVISELRKTAGCEAALFLYPGAEGDCKASLRSRGKVDVRLIASEFGGGGHAAAAGCSCGGDPAEFRKALEEKLSEAVLSACRLPEEEPAAGDADHPSGADRP